MKHSLECPLLRNRVAKLKTMWEGGSFPKTFTHDSADKIVTMIEGSNLTTYSWTGYGALASEITGTATTNYAYNGQDHLVLVTPPGGGFPTTYSFDGDGLRRSIQTTNVNQDPPTLDITTMVWDGSDYLLLNEPTQNRVVLTLDSEIVSCGSKDLLTDPLGSLVKEISAGASLGSLIELYPYGTRASALTKISIPFVYIAAYGYYNDTAERDYVRARELYKKLGRWMQTDPLWPNQRNYLYVAANPIALSDGAGLLPQKQKKVKSAVPCCSLPLNPISRLGQVYIDCNCKGVQIWVLPETGDVNKSPPCGKWLPADAIVVGKPPFQTTYKIHGQTCAYFSCPPDDENGCYAPRFEWILCRVGVAINPWLETTPTIVDFCKTFCGRPCPPACRGYLP